MAMRLLAALGLSLALALGGCTYAEEEPGLFGVRTPTAPPPDRSAPTPLPRPAPGNPGLPVAGEVVWTTGEGAALSVRFAVHAVRRIPGATVLDYSVTPLAAPGLRRGDDLPGSVDLGLARDTGSSAALWLVDPASRQAYRSLGHVSRREFHHCLCTPLWAAQPALRLGETRLLQLTYGALPAAVSQVNVLLANQLPIVRVPVTPVGQVPGATAPVDLGRPAEPAPAGSAPQTYRYPGFGTGRAVEVTVQQVAAAPGLTAVRWRIRSLTDRLDHRRTVLGPPISAEVPTGLAVPPLNAASGPTVRPVGGGAALAPSWISASVGGQPGWECLCSELGVWSRVLSTVGGAVTVTTLYPGLPAGTRRVEVELPGLAPVTMAVDTLPDAAARLGAPVAVEDDPGWVYSTDAPPLGWPPARWPSPLPDPWQLVDYRGRTEDVRPLPAG